MSTPLAGVSLETLEVALKNAGVQAETLYAKYPTWETVERIRMDLHRLYELAHEEIRIVRRAGEATE
jgi:hypothetical protein